MASITTNTTKTTKTTKAPKTTKTTKAPKTDKSNVTKSQNTTIVANIPTSEFSIFIPSVFNNLEDQVLIDTFNTLFGIDCVQKIDFYVPPTYKGQVKFKMAFVHFNNMPNNELANNFKQSIGEGKEIRIHYTDKYFWKCLMNKKANKPAPSAEEKPKFVPKMIIGTAVPNDKNKSWGDIEEEDEEEATKGAATEDEDDDESDDEE